MKEFLMGLYITHGEREFLYSTISAGARVRWKAEEDEFLYYEFGNTMTKLTPKAIEYLKHD